MIYYPNGGVWFILKVFQMKGSVFPSSFATALPCALIAALVRFLINQGHMSAFESTESILTETQAWSGFSFLVGFLIVFRTSQAYSRFWEGCSAMFIMGAEWFDSCSALCSFCVHSKAPQEKVMRFKHTLVRLFSMMHASALADLEGSDMVHFDHSPESINSIKAFRYELIDPSGIDAESLHTLRASDSRVELLFQWIQMLVVENIETGVLSIPPPILSRAFQEIANGMVAYHDSVKIAQVPFPFPYAQNCDFLLLLHWVLAPFVFTQWVTHPLWAFLFVFIQVFILWSLNFIAVEIENPFGTDMNDLDGHHMQNEMNRHLLLMLKPSTVRTPRLSEKAIWAGDPAVEILPRMARKGENFIRAWSNSDVEQVKIAIEEHAPAWEVRTSADSLHAQPPPASLCKDAAGTGIAGARATADRLAVPNPHGLPRGLAAPSSNGSAAAAVPPRGGSSGPSAGSPGGAPWPDAHPPPAVAEGSRTAEAPRAAGAAGAAEAAGARAGVGPPRAAGGGYDSESDSFGL